MRDMNVPDRSIRNIPVPANHRRVAAPQETYEEDYAAPPRGPQGPRGGRRGRSWFFWALIIVILVCIIAGVLLSTLFVHVTINVALKHETVTAPQSLEAELNPVGSALAYAVVTTSRNASTTVKASGTQQVSKSASGIITVYDDYSTAPQQLVTNTRFEAPNGDIYRIHSTITVPGATKNSDGSLSPGSTSVTAYADQPGASYNISSSTQFTIPGFEGDPRYAKFYARSSSMTGGFVGMQATIAPADLTAAEAALKSGLDSSLENAGSGVPSGFIELPGTLAISYSDVTQSQNSDGTVAVSQTASATLDVVRSNDLAAAIARAQVADYNGAAVGFADPSQLKITVPNATSTSGSITLNLSGSPTLVWQFDPDTLKQALLGKPKSQFETIVDSFAPAIDCSSATPCTASIRPFWETSFPNDPAKISVNAQ